MISPSTLAALRIDCVEMLEAAWAEHGPAAIESLRRIDPAAYIKLMALVVVALDDGPAPRLSGPNRRRRSAPRRRGHR